jgi:hypothetical protein
VSILTEKFKSAKDNLQIVRIEVGYEGKAYYGAFIEDWDKNYLVIKYLDTTDTSSVIERTILIKDITEFKVARPIDLEESYLKSDPESSPFLSALLFADDNPGDESDAVMDEIFYEVGVNYGYYEDEENEDGQEQFA